MLTLYTGSGAVPLNVDGYYIRQLASGLDELCFEVSIWDEAFQAIQEESSILEQSESTDAAYYLVKAIDAGADTANVKCQIDLDEWKASLSVNYKSASLSVAALIRTIAPAGWTVSDESSLSYSRTIELTSATPLDVLEQCRETFNGVTYRFDNVNKVLTIVNMASGQNLGAFATRDLNLKENNYKGKSAGFATRLYAYGKDGLSFASINGGKPYVDNNTYSSRVICAFWKDERYTIAANLLEAAIERLETMAVPQRSFDCDVVDLAATNPEKYAELNFELFSRCILIDQTRSGSQIVHIIVERWIYPYLPQQNKVVLSTVPPRIQTQVTQIINSLNNQNSIYQQQQSSAQQNAIENATAQITGAKGGNMRAIYDSNGNWTELVVMNTESILTASKLWRFNLGGFGYSPNGYNGPYTTAITMDGAIVADFITTGTLDASKATVTNLNASNISTGTLAAARIAAHSLNVDKITGSLSGKGYPTDSNSWGINFQTGELTIGNVTAANITAGTLSADRIAANSIAVSKLSGSISAPGYSGDSNSWVLNLTDGTLTIGNITASNIKTGTLDASQVTVSNLNASNITAGTLNVDRINAKSITGAKIADNTITGGSSGNIAIGTLTGGVDGYGAATGNIAAGTVLGGNIATGTITGGVNSGGVATGNLSAGGVAYGNTSFTGTLDQVGTNQSDIAAINNMFAYTLYCTNLNVSSGFTWNGHYVSTVNITSGGVVYSCLYASG